MALVTAERLHRWKCLFCGSKDKNISTMKAPTSNVCGTYSEAVKIVACDQCGHIEIFAHSSNMLAMLLVGNHSYTLEESEKFVKDFHLLNHNDPKRNPHAVVGPKGYENT